MRTIFPRTARDCRKHDHIVFYTPSQDQTPYVLANSLYARAVWCKRCGALMIHPDHIAAAKPVDKEV